MTKERDQALNQLKGMKSAEQRVQAAQAPSYVRSWREDRVVTTETCDTIADGLATCVPTEPNVRAIRELVDEVCLVSEDELLEGIRTLLFEEHLVAEPAGAATTAAAAGCG